MTTRPTISRIDSLPRWEIVDSKRPGVLEIVDRKIDFSKIICSVYFSKILEKIIKLGALVSV